jgi:acyl carrier protein
MGFPDRPTKADVLREIQQWMRELFELDSDRVQPDARLIEDLELDSLDAFDLAVKVEETTGIAFDENKIRELRTVDDVISAIHTVLSAQGAPELHAATPQTDP